MIQLMTAAKFGDGDTSSELLSVDQGVRATRTIVERAVLRPHGSRRERLLDRVFSLAFRGLVYAQIWEDPVADMLALDIDEGMHVLCIASGSCNALSYLTAGPASITAIDLNAAHVALGKLKIAAVRYLPDSGDLRRFFVAADDRANIAAYHHHLAPHLDGATRRYWEGRSLAGRQRIAGFASGIYKQGLLGRFIGAAHFLARLYRVDLGVLLQARDRTEQRRLFDEHLAPLFDKKLVRWLTKHPASIFGLGIPPAQYTALAGGRKMADVLRQRLEKLACDFPANDNYFAWQAFARSYGSHEDAPLPPWLEARHYATMRANIDRCSVVHGNFVDHLEAQADASLDRFVLLDAQDWMDDAGLTRLWREITRTARPGARVLFRTAGEETLLPGRIPDDILAQWDYSLDECRRLTSMDRSAIYGGMHLYRFRR